MKESEIRPREIFNKYLELAEKDVEGYFSKCKYRTRNCPACRNKGKFEFRKKGFDYHLCYSCNTLFANPIPENEAFEAYYRESPSTKFWATDFYKHTEDARREKIFRPRARAINEIIASYNPDVKVVLDIGGGYGTFAEEMKKTGGYEIYVIEPNGDLGKIVQEKNIRIIPKFLEEVTGEDLPKKPKCFTSFELMEHLTDPREFLEAVFNMMERGDLFVFTTLNGLGLDILVLWENAKAIHPPHHINFFNPGSIRILLEEIGFEIRQITTPGELDIDILENNKEFIRDKFWKYFIENADEKVKKSMQAFIQKNSLSSHMRVIVQK